MTTVSLLSQQFMKQLQQRTNCLRQQQHQHVLVTTTVIYRRKISLKATTTATIYSPHLVLSSTIRTPPPTITRFKQHMNDSRNGNIQNRHYDGLGTSTNYHGLMSTPTTKAITKTTTTTNRLFSSSGGRSTEDGTAAAATVVAATGNSTTVATRFSSLDSSLVHFQILDPPVLTAVGSSATTTASSISSHPSLLSSFSLDFQQYLKERQLQQQQKSNQDDNNSNIKNNHSGTIGIITLNSPSTYNALTNEMGIEFQYLCQEIQYEIQNKQLSSSKLQAQNIQVLIVTGGVDNSTTSTSNHAGTGSRGGSTGAFSAGGNLQWLQSLKNNTIQQNYDEMIQFYNYFFAIRDCIPIPIIAAVNGPAMGAGACLSLLCDLRTASLRNSERLFGFHFTRLGIHSGMGGSALLRSVVGNHSTWVNEILLLGQTLSAKQCYEKYSIVNRLHDTCAQIAAYEMAMEMINNTSPVAIQLMIQTLRIQQEKSSGFSSFQEILQQEALSQAICYHQKDWGEGLIAIKEKRKPNFQKNRTDDMDNK